MSAGKLTIKNVKEVIDLSALVTEVIVKELAKDGFQWNDLVKVFQSPDFDHALREAVDGFQLVDDELKDLTFFEGVELARYTYEKTARVLDILRNSRGLFEPAKKAVIDKVIDDIKTADGVVNAVDAVVDQVIDELNKGD